ncbi:hypothetical protein FJM67_00325 [Maribrevibacterium harenarium]|uniref:Uncharacterized protein n=1 Tax=Maribrevibacterium harenarium TaxID=2589817 RepID=A0A501X508_9GAMM|nr:hypothetical protein [Maribrevibacterium harenarium]TPE55531.1 hypothetical protein FJM67_00325 [Maribrevibacterium harenarium]
MLTMLYTVALSAFVAGSLRLCYLPFSPLLLFIPPLIFVNVTMTSSPTEMVLFVAFWGVILFAADQLFLQRGRLDIEAESRSIAGAVFGGFVAGQILSLLPSLQLPLLGMMIIIPLFYWCLPNVFWELSKKVFLVGLVFHALVTVFLATGTNQSAMDKKQGQSRNLTTALASLGALVGILAAPVSMEQVSILDIAALIIVLIVCYGAGAWLLAKRVASASQHVYPWLLGAVGYSYLIRVNYLALAN